MSGVDWTVVICAAIAAVQSTIAVMLGAHTKNQLKTPSGPSVGEQVERAHLTAIANNMLLSRKNGPTKTLPPEEVKEEHPPQIADEETA